jgi:histidinol-phosphate aminotransferase
MDRRLWSDAAKAVTPYIPGEQPITECVKLNTNENPYPPSPKVRETLASFDILQLRKYPDPSSSKLRKTLAEKNKVTKENVFVGNGSDEILAFAFRAFFDKNRPVTFADVTYSFYPVYADSLSIPVKQISLTQDLELPVQEYIESPSGVIIANPNAPTGIPVSIGDIERIVRSDTGRLVIVDEAYVDFGAVSSVELTKKYDNLLVVQTLSKSRALAGMRVGFAFGDPSLITALERIRDTVNSYTVDRLAQETAVAAILDEDWFFEITKRIIETREELRAKLKGLGFEVLPSAANFVFVRHLAIDAYELYEALKKKGILVRYFDMPRIDDRLRITVGTPEEVEILYTALKEIIS